MSTCDAFGLYDPFCWSAQARSASWGSTPRSMTLMAATQGNTPGPTASRPSTNLAWSAAPSPGLAETLHDQGGELLFITRMLQPLHTVAVLLVLQQLQNVAQRCGIQTTRLFRAEKPPQHLHPHLLREVGAEPIQQSHPKPRP